VPDRIGGRLGVGDHGKIDICNQQSLLARVKRFGERRPVRPVNPCMPAAGLQELALFGTVAQGFDHRRTDDTAGGKHETLAFGGIHLAGRAVDLRPEGIGGAGVKAEARPGRDMHLLVLGIHGIFGQRLQMFPAAQGAKPADRRVVHGYVAAVAFAEHGALDMGRLELAPPCDRLTVGTIDPLAHIERAASPLRDAENRRQVVAFGSIAQRLVLRTVDLDGVFEIPADKLHAPGRSAEPDPPGIAGDPGLGKGNDVDALRTGLVDQRNRLVDRPFQIEKFRRRLHGGGLELGLRHLGLPYCSGLQRA